MKKEYIAVYLGLALFLAAFLAAALLDGFGYKDHSRIAACISLIFFGLTVLAGLYSNVKHYGFFYTHVRRQDVNLSFDQLDRKYPGIKKGTKSYGAGIAIAAVLFGLAPVLFGMRLLAKEFAMGRL